MTSETRKLRFFSKTKYKTLDENEEQRPLDWHTFARENRSIPISMLFGTVFCLAAVGYTAWLSRQLLFKPTWAVDIEIHPVAKWNAENLALCQGFVTIFYAVGLYSIAFAAQAISETALWPLHSRRPLGLDQMDTYLLAVRGSIPPLNELIRLCDSLHLGLFLVASIVVFMTPLAAAPLVGTVWTRIDTPYTFKTMYHVGGGIGRMFAQVNPPVSVGAESLAAYIAWSRGLSAEIRPDLRGWIVCRPDMRELGDFTARAVRVQQTVTCNPFALTEIKSPGKDIALFGTNMAKQNYRNRLLDSSDNVKVRLAETLAVWADTFDFIHANRSTARIVFAAFNGTIESGIEAKLSDDAYWYPTTVSSVACDIDIEFIDDLLIVGNGSPKDRPIPTLSSIEGIHISFRNNTQDKNSPENTLNENALWSAVAPIIVCPSVDGAQPMYYRDPDSNVSIPTGYTKAPFNTYERGLPANDWTLDDLKRFINVSVGSTALASAQNFREDHPEQQTIYTVVKTRKLDPARVVYLAIPVIIIVAGEILLMYWNVILHRQEGITMMRMARITDILENVRPGSIVELQRMGSVRSANGATGDGSRRSSIKGVKIEMRSIEEPDDIVPGNEPARDLERMVDIRLDQSNPTRITQTFTTSTDAKAQYVPWDSVAPRDRAEFQKETDVFKEA